MTQEFSDTGLPDAVTNELASLYASAASQLADMVLHPPAKSDKAKAWQQARAAQLMQQVDAMMLELKQHTAVWTADNLPQAFLDGIKLAEQQAKDLNLNKVPLVKASFAMIDKDTLKVFSQNIVKDLNKAADSMHEDASTVLRATAQHNLDESDINRILAKNYVWNSPAATIKELTAAFEAVNAKVVTFDDKNGDPISFDAKYYASMVVRTKTRQATVVARHGRLQSLDLDLVSVVGRVSKNFCTAYLGQVFSISGKSEKYPSLKELPSGGPPFHPNCSKSTRPFVEELASGQQLEAADGPDDSEKMLNVDTSEAQRRFKDLQMYQQVKQNYATTADKLYAASK